MITGYVMGAESVADAHEIAMWMYQFNGLSRMTINVEKSAKDAGLVGGWAAEAPHNPQPKPALPS
jgi:hypothetical protein